MQFLKEAAALLKEPSASSFILPNSDCSEVSRVDDTANVLWGMQWTGCVE